MLRYEKVMHQMWSVVGVEPLNTAPVDAAPIGLYIGLGKTRTFEMNVMQKINYTLESFQTLHIWYLPMIDRTNIT